MDFSEYIVYIEESGDHGLANINPDHPVAVLDQFDNSHKIKLECRKWSAPA